MTRIFELNYFYNFLPAFMLKCIYKIQFCLQYYAPYLESLNKVKIGFYKHFFKQ